MSKKRNKGSNGQGAAPAMGRRPSMDQVLQAMAHGVMTELHHMYPHVPEMTKRKAAQATAAETPHVSAFVQAMQGDSDYIVLRMGKKSLVALDNQPLEGVEFVAHKHLRDCKTVQEAFATVAIMGILTSNIARGLLHMEGYVFEGLHAKDDNEQAEGEQPANDSTPE